MLIRFSILLFFVILFSCDKSKLPGDSLAFGLSFPECEGDCAFYFLLKNGKIYEDEVKSIQDKMAFSNISSSDSKYQKCKFLNETVPKMLLDGGGTLGNPGDHDQAIVNLRIKRNGKVRNWVIDSDTNKIPPEIRLYISSLQKVVFLIQ